MTALPEPPLPADVDLRDFAFMPLDVVRLRDSDLAAVPDGEVFRAAVLAWSAAWHQVPAASLPDEDPVLARLLGYGRDVKGWKKLREAGALKGFQLCSDGRLYHMVVAEKAIRAWTRHHRLRHAALRKTSSKRMKGSSWSKVRKRIFQAQGSKCAMCGTTAHPLEIDHVRPLAEAGSNQDSNLQVLCRPCNRKKSYKIIARGSF